jgi:hypothetical protein
MFSTIMIVRFRSNSGGRYGPRRRPAAEDEMGIPPNRRRPCGSLTYA